jgi:hypothetical protein
MLIASPAVTVHTPEVVTVAVKPDAVIVEIACVGPLSKLPDKVPPPLAVNGPLTENPEETAKLPSGFAPAGTVRV